jgi:hypothetical protein
VFTTLSYSDVLAGAFLRVRPMTLLARTKIKKSRKPIRSTYARKPLCRGEIGHALDVDLEPPEVAGKLAHRRDRELGEPPIPPSPRRLL